MLPEQPLRDRFLNQLDAQLRRELAVPGGARLCVAYSGGTDSTALLAALTALAPVRGYRVRAVHVNHGLQAEADAWERRCRANCDALGVPFQVRHWQGGASRGESEEAAARAGRYALLAEALAEGEWLATAHQADDQAETGLLFLARGAGLDGLAGIEPRRPFGGGSLIRPLLPFRRRQLAEFVARCGLDTVADPANTAARYARVRARHVLLPCLSEAMGEGSIAAAARSVGLLQDARQVLDARMGERLAALEQADGSLIAAGLAALPPAEGRLVLREALRRRGLPLPDRDTLERARALAQRTDGKGRVGWRGGRVRRTPAALCLDGGEPADGAAVAWPDPAVPLVWGHGRLEATAGIAPGPPWPAAEGQWVAATAMAEGVWVRSRRSGDRARPAGGGPCRSVGEMMRAAGIPAEQREDIPLLVDGHGTILAVPGVTVTAVGAAVTGQPAWRLSWHRTAG
jgi:tRNA(Ile)-lysidine synthase